MSDFGMPYLMELGTPEMCAALARDLGLDFVELNISFPACQLERLSAQALRALREKYGVYFTLHMDEEADPFAFNHRVREAWLDTFREALALCREACIPVLNMHMPRGVYITLDGTRHYMYARYREAYLSRVAALRDVCEEVLAGSNVIVCIENTGGFLPHEREAVECLLESDRFGLTLDIGHDHAADHADWPFYAAHLDRLRHMHAHDCAGKRDHLALGCGEIDLPQRLGLAVAQNARILVEIKTVASLRQSVANLRAFAPTTAALEADMLHCPVCVTVDRPLGSRHPRKPDILYTVNYGFVKGLLAGDGGWQDAYILGVDAPVHAFTGRVIAVIRRRDDAEDKWIVAPEGARFTPDEIMAQVRFVEQYFDAYVEMVE